MARRDPSSTLFHSSSLLSRDPEGVDPNGYDIYQIDPVGSALTGPQMDPIPTPQFQNNSDPLDVAALVGAPPPPPKTPPPKRSSRRRSKGKNTTPTSSAVLSSSSNENGVTPRGMSEGFFPEDQDDEENDKSVLKLISKNHVNLDMSAMEEVENRHDIRGQDRPQSVSPPPEPRSQNSTPSSKSSRSVAEERRKKAMAIYNSDQLVIDEEADHQGLEVRAAMSAMSTLSESNKSKPAPVQQSVKESVSPSKRSVVPSSPQSQSTEQHGNLNRGVAAAVSTENQQPFSVDQVETNDTSLFGIDHVATDHTDITEDASAISSNKKDTKKRGFFKKLFRGKSKDAASVTSGKSGKSKNKVNPVVPRPAAAGASQQYQSLPPSTAEVAANSASKPKSLEPSPRGQPQQQTMVETHDHITLQHSLTLSKSDEEDPALLALERQLGYGSKNSPSTQNSKTTSMSAPGASPKTSAALSPIESEAFSKVSSKMSFSPESSDDRQGVFFANDDVSALTGPSYESRQKSKSISFDPEPVGQYEPPLKSTRAQDALPQPQDAPMPTPARHRLQLDVPDHPIVDPDGDSPVHIGTPVHRTIETAVTSDPVGESPMAAWAKSYDFGPQSPDGMSAPTPVNRDRAISVEHAADDESAVSDPPLDHGYISEDSSSHDHEEEKKEDDDEEKVAVEDKRDIASLISPSDVTTLHRNSKAIRAALDAKQEEENSPAIDAPTQDAPLAVVADPASPEVEVLMEEVSTPVANPELQINTELAMSGFKSKNNTPAGEGNPNHFSVTGAALYNAKAVEYLHKLHGKPSPRHSWHVKNQPVAPSPANMTMSAKKRTNKEKPEIPLHKKPSPGEYVADNFEVSEEEITGIREAVPEEALLSKISLPDHLERRRAELEAARRPPPTPEDARIKKRFFGAEDSSEQAAYKAKFKGRKPKKKPTIIDVVENAESISPTATSPRTPSPKAEFNVMVESSPANMIKPPTPIGNVISTEAVSKGIGLRRKKRDDDIESGRAERVVLTPKPQPEGRNRFNFFPAKEEEIKDPIQRAGRRLLSKSAIPIQCAVRRMIARREAVDRMWAIIQLQSYVRRWRCETSLQAHVHSATLIQSSIRRFNTRCQVEKMHDSATQIQKIMRSYLAQAMVYDKMYYVVLLQSVARMFVAKCLEVKKQKSALLIQRVYRGHSVRFANSYSDVALVIQTAYRRHLAKKACAHREQSICRIQAAWRSYNSRIAFQLEIVDIIIAQSIVRRWLAKRSLKIMKISHLAPQAVLIQGPWRGAATRSIIARTNAATKIQSTWRGFQAYTDYIFSLVDILVVQRTFRKHLAKKRVQKMRENRAATLIQATFRMHQSRMKLVISLLHIIVAQSVARRFLSRFKVERRKTQSAAVAVITKALKENASRNAKKKADAATKIAAAWRGFWAFSHYIIVQYETTKLQAAVRGKLARNKYNLHLGCVIIIQAMARQYLAKKEIDRRVVERAAKHEAAIIELRERNAAKRIQFWWRIVLDWTKEKKAALTIERFFIHVRAEVDREVMRREQRRLSKDKKKRKKRRSSEGGKRKSSLNTVDEDMSGAFSFQEAETLNTGVSSRSQSAPRMRAPSPRRAAAAAAAAAGAKASSRAGSSPRMVPKSSPRANQKPALRLDVSDRSRSRHADLPSPRSQHPTGSIRTAPSHDVSEISAVTTPSVLRTPKSYTKNLRQQVQNAKSPSNEPDLTDELDQAFKQLESNVASHKVEPRARPGKHRPTTEDYIKKYGMSNSSARTPVSPQRSLSPGGRHFFPDQLSEPREFVDESPRSHHSSAMSRGSQRSSSAPRSRSSHHPPPQHHRNYTKPPSSFQKGSSGSNSPYRSRIPLPGTTGKSASINDEEYGEI